MSLVKFYLRTSIAGPSPAPTQGTTQSSDPVTGSISHGGYNPGVGGVVAQASLTPETTPNTYKTTLGVGASSQGPVGLFTLPAESSARKISIDQAFLVYGQELNFIPPPGYFAGIYIWIFRPGDLSNVGEAWSDAGGVAWDPALWIQVSGDFEYRRFTAGGSSGTVDVQVGDRILVEVWYKKDATSPTGATFGIGGSDESYPQNTDLYWGTYAPFNPSAYIELDITEHPPIQPPIIVVPTDGSTTNDPTPVISGTSEALSTVNIYDGVTLVETAVTDGAGNWTGSASTLTAGSHSLTGTATRDVTFEVSAASDPPVVFTVDTAPAAPVITSPVDGALLSTTAPTVTGTAEASSTVKVYSGATLKGTFTANGSGNWSGVVSALPQGAQVLTATATDSYPNTSAPSTGINVTVDTVAPSAPIILNPPEGSVQVLRYPELRGTAEANSTVKIWLDGVLALTVVATGGIFAGYSSVRLADGVHVLTATATDAAANVSAVTTVNFYVDPCSVPADHAVQALSRLAQYLKGKCNLQLLVTAFTAQGANLDTCLEDLKTERTIETATGAQLTVLGDIVGQERAGLSDELYLAAIRSKIKLNNSSGTIEELYQIVALLQPTATMRVVDYPPAGFTLRVYGLIFTDESFALLLSVFQKARAAGVRGILEGMWATPSLTFTFDGTTAQALDNGLWSGAGF